MNIILTLFIFIFIAKQHRPPQPLASRAWGVRSREVYGEMKRLENKHRRYIPEESWLKFRRVLVDWMCEAGDEFQLHISTMHVAVMYLDRMLQSLQISPQAPAGRRRVHPHRS